ncbi:DUF6148 family protein [Hoeflea sp. TYP-13]|uniref:DUF6148 family protein n=1 Tax=Hoeflea sp. TYP-13 TaxID=3230023 RepID=UPI0034C5B464
MAGITLADAQAQLAVWLAASTAVASNQSYSINGRSMTRADAGEIREQIDYWQGWVTKLDTANSGRRRVRYGVAR